ATVVALAATRCRTPGPTGRSRRAVAGPTTRQPEPHQHQGEHMKFGFSSYSFHAKMRTGEMSILDVIDWVAESEAEHLEFAVLTDDADSPVPNINTPAERIAEIKKHAADRGVTLSNL